MPPSSYLPLAGRSDDATWRRRGGGMPFTTLGGSLILIALPALLERDAPHPARMRAPTSPQGGGMKFQISEFLI